MHDPVSLLSGIRFPGDLKKLDIGELNRLAAEIRGIIVSTVSRTGGHLASNLGVVELTVALHRVFNSPEDKIVWDVGHQCYAHKLLTGRREAFSGLRRAGGLAGFPKRSESPHDVFNTGHASTSISAALGLLAGERIRGGKARAVAVIGDGALTGGMAYEALSHAGQLGLPLVVILNDNKMSISPNVGGLSKYLSRLSMKAKYQLFRRTFDAIAQRIPFFGDIFFGVVLRLKRAVKAVFYTDNFFVDLGFEYVGPIEGHHIRSLTEIFEDVKRLERPVVIHVITRKGKGYRYAEDDPGRYHGVGSFSVSGGLGADGPAAGGPVTGGPAAGGPVTGLGPAGETPSFTGVFGQAILGAAERDPQVVAVTAAMEKGTGLPAFRKAFPGRFFDVGIAEEHAVTFAAGLAARGLRPVAAVYSTFIQRSTDQIIHDVALQKLPVIFALDRAGFVDGDGETHQGLFDIALFRAAPGMTILAPAGETEFRAMLDYALKNRGAAGEAGPVMIRYPKAPCPAGDPAFSLPLEEGRGVFAGPGAPQAERAFAEDQAEAGRGGRPDVPVCLAFTGSLYPQALAAADKLADRGLPADCYNLRFLKPVDEDYLGNLMDHYELMVFIEEGIRGGGFGEYASDLALRRGFQGRVLALAAGDDFAAQGTREELLRMNRLDGEGIAASVEAEYRGLEGLRDRFRFRGAAVR
ncbi:MAG: 1-deoxy-D-xylulose-5-phosphate synthase [Treponema sp.]|jgi:1-deoxy-D-xylulose-5-phosphate synthase|nr:1-deoxy-D-xylulose-5-phosphate synthase [Treponema sp.]